MKCQTMLCSRLWFYLAPVLLVSAYSCGGPSFEAAVSSPESSTTLSAEGKEADSGELEAALKESSEVGKPWESQQAVERPDGSFEEASPPAKPEPCLGENCAPVPCGGDADSHACDFVWQKHYSPAGCCNARNVCTFSFTGCEHST